MPGGDQRQFFVLRRRFRVRLLRVVAVLVPCALLGSGAVFAVNAENRASATEQVPVDPFTGGGAPAEYRTRVEHAVFSTSEAAVELAGHGAGRLIWFVPPTLDQPEVPTTTRVRPVPSTTRQRAVPAPTAPKPASGDPGRGSSARFYAALREMVPQAWLDAVPFTLEVIGGYTSYAGSDGVIQVSRYHLNSPWPRFRFVVAHEWGHMVAFEYGTGVELGSPPAGFPYRGPNPPEYWADCVGVAFSGIQDPSHGLAPCAAADLSWTLGFFAAGPPGAAPEVLPPATSKPERGVRLAQMAAVVPRAPLGPWILLWPSFPRMS